MFATRLLRRKFWIVFAFSALIQAYAGGIALAFFGKECVVSKKAEVFENDSGKRVVGVLSAGEITYVSWVFGGYSGIHSFDGSRFQKLGVASSSSIECDLPQSNYYPLIVEAKDAKSALAQLGLASKEHTCPFVGDGALSVGFSEDYYSAYKNVGMPISNLCLVLQSGQIRFNPETGQRLPTYVLKGSGRADEYALAAPTCASKGTVTYGQNYGELNPIGCAVNFHPWSGRKLLSNEASVFTRLLSLAIDGSAGEVMQDNTSLVSEPSRRATSARLQDLRDKLGPQ
jgi:hypothetical protein